RAAAADGPGAAAADGLRAAGAGGPGSPTEDALRTPVAEGARSAGGVLGAVPTLLGLGVALPGPLDHGRGVLHRVTGFPEWDGYPLRDALERR
ncbi:ROK family protein, partial [Streptomyces coelicoflavus]|nr:ROK family protein [Streptomyces coelicoflavus]